MPFDSGGSYSLPSGYTAVADTTILTTQHNPPLEDIAAALTACVKRNGAGAMTGLLTLSGDPTSGTHAATKTYVDTQVLGALAASGIQIKAPALLATTGNITLSGEQTIDGTLTSGNRVLVLFQTTTADNGIYLTASGAWARATDADSWAELTNATVPVEKGTVWADTLWQCTADAGGTLGATTVFFRRVDWQLRMNVQTGTSYTVLTSDYGKYVTYDNSSAVAVTLPQANATTFPAAWFQFVENKNTGVVTYTPTTSTINGGATLALQKGQWALIVSDGTNYRALLGGVPQEVLVVAVGDETSAITAGTSKITFRMPFAMKLTAVRGSLSTAQTSGSIFTVDINDSGTTVLSTKLTIDNTEKTSTTAATPAVISDSALADDAEITIDVDQVGDGTAKGLKVALIGYRT